MARSRYGRMWCGDGPGRRSGAARLANSQRSGRVSRGSMISSIQNVSPFRSAETFWIEEIIDPERLGGPERRAQLGEAVLDLRELFFPLEGGIEAAYRPD